MRNYQTQIDINIKLDIKIENSKIIYVIVVNFGNKANNLAVLPNIYKLIIWHIQNNINRQSTNVYVINVVNVVNGGNSNV